MKNIIIFCDGGLGNRLGVLVGGLLTADIIGKTPIICWPKNTWCGCSFNDIFDSNFDVIDDDINKLFSNMINYVFLIHENQTSLQLPKIFSHSMENLDLIKNFDENVIYYHNIIPSYFSNQEIIEKLNSLKIQKNITETVYNFITEEKINNETFGLHFRKTDFNSNINDIEILNEIGINFNKTYFICSDDEETENMFKSLPNVKTFEKTHYVEKLVSGDWNEWITDNEGRKFKFNVNRKRESVIQAFIDLLILSKTNMRGNELSTFFQFSKLYSNVKI